MSLYPAPTALGPQAPERLMQLIILWNGNAHALVVLSEEKTALVS